LNTPERFIYGMNHHLVAGALGRRVNPSFINALNGFDIDIEVSEGGSTYMGLE